MMNKIRVKICGITNQEDALKAAEFGAWALGFVFYKESPRNISPFKAKKIVDLLPPFIVPVGVFVNQRQGAIEDIASFCGIRTLQLHGEETPEFCQRLKRYKIIKAFRVNDHFEGKIVLNYKNVNAILLDTYSKDSYGGTGKTFNWNFIREVKGYHLPIILAGGLNPENILNAVEEIQPYALDVSSGVEQSPGKKSEQLLKELFSKLN